MNRTLVHTAARIVAASLVAVGPLTMAHAQAQYPNKPVTVIVPFAAGGNLDVVTRLVTGKMGESLGQPFVIDNRGGAGGVVGLQAAQRAQPDGYTMAAIANGSFAITPKLLNPVPFKLADFEPVGSIALTPLVLAVAEGSRFSSVDELLEYAKTNPGQVSVGHPGNGTTNHLAIIQVQRLAGVEFTVVPYRGSAPAVADALGGQIDAVVDQLPSSLAHIQAGKLKALAVTTAQRAKELASVPTLAEAGLEGFDVSTTTGFLVPAKTPAAVIDSLNQALNHALQTPEVQKRLQELGSAPQPSSPEQFSDYLKSEERLADELIKQGLLQDK